MKIKVGKLASNVLVESDTANLVYDHLEWQISKQKQIHTLQAVKYSF